MYTEPSLANAWRLTQCYFSCNISVTVTVTVNVNNIFQNDNSFKIFRFQLITSVI